MRRYKKQGLLVFFLLMPMMLLGIGLYCCYKKGFNIGKISSKLRYNEAWETEPLTHEQKEELIHQIFSQKFYFLSSGSLSYVFVSKNDKYVLKFFKMYKILPKNWLRDFPFSLFEKYRFDHVEKKEHLFENIFRNFKIAFEELREESGLIYLHLNKTRELRKKVTLIDQEGKKIQVDLDSKEFVVQRKAMDICDYFLSFKGTQKEDELRRGVRNFLQLIASRCKKGYGDQNTDLRNNCGFVDGRIIFFDFDLLFADESLKNPHYLQMQILSAVEMFAHWAEQFYPDLANILQEEAQYVIDACVSK